MEKGVLYDIIHEKTEALFLEDKRICNCIILDYYLEDLLRLFQIQLSQYLLETIKYIKMLSN